MSKLSRLLAALASLSLVGMLVAPIWRIALLAPQYPEGLGMLIRIDTLTGFEPHDLDNINELNHYIGMKAIVADAIPELRVMKWVVVGLIVIGLLVAAVGKRKGLVAWLGALVIAGGAGMVDFWKWMYDYGHDLDFEHAIIKIPGMTYTPPIIGVKQLLNFTASSWPGVGGLSAGLAFVLGAAALVVAYRQGAARVATGAAVRPAALVAGD